MRDNLPEVFHTPRMDKPKRVPLQPTEQDILDNLRVVQLIDPAELKRCDKLIIEHHYLHDATLVGEHMRYAVVYRGQWLALASWSAAALHLRDRDQFIGWTHEQCRRRRALIANNARLLVLPGRQCPNLISRFMKLMLQRLSADWQQRWGHPIALVESFVDPKLYQGTAYKVSGWSHLGLTAGWKRDADDFYLQHDSPKQIWVRELVRKACVKLRAKELPQEWAPVETGVAAKCTFKVEPILSLMELFKKRLPEFRRPQSLSYPLPGMLSLIVMAMATGVRQGPEDLANYADTLSQGQLRALNFRHDRRTRRLRSPKRTTFSRVLEAVDASALEAVLLQWQEQLIGPTQDTLVVVDGKKLRHGGAEIVNMVDGNGRFLGSALTPDKTNEIPIARELLSRLNLDGRLVLADALHTCRETARQIHFEQGGDYLLTVKGNQKDLHQTLEKLFEKQPFSPSAHAEDPSADTGAQLRADRNPTPRLPGGDAQPGGVPGGAHGRTPGDPGTKEQKMGTRDGVPDQQPEPRRVTGPGGTLAQAQVLGHRESPAPLSGHHTAGGPQPGAQPQLGSHPGDDPAPDRESVQRGGGPGSEDQPEDQT